MTIPAIIASLRAAGRSPPVPCELVLDDGCVLAVDRWLRVLPGKRLTGAGRWNGQLVLAKLFVAPRGSERHWQRECRGVESLAKHGLPTPPMLASGRLGEEGYFVLSAYFEGARCPDATSTNELERVFEMIGRMHALGIVQEDAHLGNFLAWKNELYVIDGDAVQAGITKGETENNLALLLAQLPPDQEVTPLVAAYHRANPALAIDQVQLAREVACARSRRLADYLKKCLRDCSLFAVEKRRNRFSAVVRSEADFLAPIIADPDRWLENGTPLKRGQTASVALIEHAGRQLVIKRYNIKGARHALSRCWRPSRAWHSWIEGHRLRFMDIATPRPLAMIEQRAGPLRGKAWLITDYCDGEKLVDRLRCPDTLPPTSDLDAIGRLLRQLVAARITHGDLKATNLLWCGGEPHLIDLDAMSQHASEAAFKRAWQKDRARFLRNWPEGSVLQRALEAVLTPT